MFGALVLTLSASSAIGEEGDGIESPESPSNAAKRRASSTESAAVDIAFDVEVGTAVPSKPNARYAGDFKWLSNSAEDSWVGDAKGSLMSGNVFISNNTMLSDLQRNFDAAE